MVFAALFAALIGVLGMIPPIPLGFIPVPITAQTLGVMLAGGFLGKKTGSLSLILFIVLVALGLPLLSGGRGGLSALVGPSALLYSKLARSSILYRICDRKSLVQCQNMESYRH